MEDTIIALLNNNLRVIIPDFGAFIIRQKQPRIIVFNEFLRYNDNILIDFIVKTEGIDRDIAEQRVIDFAEDGSKLLASGRELVIEGLGSLRKDSSGKINFMEAPEIIEIEIKDAVEPEKVTVIEEKQDIPQTIEQEILQKNEQEIPQTIEQEVPQTNEQEILQTNEQEIPQTNEQEIPQTNEQEIPQVIEKKTPKKPGAKTSTLTQRKTKKAPAKVRSPRTTKPLPKTFPPDVPLQVIESMAVETEEVIETAPVQPQTPIETTAVEAEAAIEASAVLTQEAVDAAVAELHSANEPEAIRDPQTIKPVLPTASMPPQASEPAWTDGRPSSISTNRILAWVLIILFVNAGILAWFVFRKKTHGTPAGKSPTTMISDTLFDRLADSVRAAALDSSIVYNEVPEEGGNPDENALTPGSRYYIVAGCFRDEVNADSLVSSLKLLGYKAEKFGKIGNLFAVCFASFDNKDTAVSELKRIREKVPSAWMTKF